MSNKKQTAVEFLLDKITLKKIDEGIYTYPTITVEEMEQFKEIEKQQIMDAYADSTSQFSVDSRIDYPKTAEQYYNETFKQELEKL